MTKPKAVGYFSSNPQALIRRVVLCHEKIYELYSLKALAPKLLDPKPRRTSGPSAASATSSRRQSKVRVFKKVLGFRDFGYRV